MESDFTIIHISDLHFTEGSSNLSTHSHSIDHLKAFSEDIRNYDLDKLVVTGDLSDNGSPDSLANAWGYLFREIPIGNGEMMGLNLPYEKVGLVPGNHDVCKCNKYDPKYLRSVWPNALENFNLNFPRHQSIPHELPKFDWLEKDDSGIFIVYTDSCYLGDGKLDKMLLGKNFAKTAKGEITIEQTERLLRWYDKGRKGNLLNPNSPSKNIPAESFRKSLKIIAMHHYLFKNRKERRSDFQLRLKQKEIVCGNLALAEFDLLLCGHSHLDDYVPTRYEELYGKRAKGRLLFNQYRHIIGINSRPLQYQSNGLRISKKISVLISLFSLTSSRSESSHFSLS